MMKSKKQKTLRVRIDDELHNWLQQQVEAHPGRLTISQFVRNLLEETSQFQQEADKLASARKELKPLVVGQAYSRHSIRQLVGGGSIQTYLPSVGGRILCACLHPSGSLPAEDLILVGTQAQTVNSANRLFSQGGTIPLFIKESPGHWIYRGRYEVNKDESWLPGALPVLSSAETEQHEGKLKEYARSSGRKEITGYLKLERISDN